MYLEIAQLIISILLILVVLLQGRGTGLSGSAFGGSGTAIYRSKRGLEKYLFFFTIMLSLLLIALSIYSLAV